MKHYRLSIIVILTVTLFTVTSVLAQSENNTDEKRAIILEILANTGLDKFTIAGKVNSSSAKAFFENWAKAQKGLSDSQMEELKKLAIEASVRADKTTAEIFNDQEAANREFQALLASQFDAGLSLEELRDLADYTKKPTSKNGVQLLLNVLSRASKKAGDDAARRLKFVMEKTVADEMFQLEKKLDELKAQPQGAGKKEN